MQKIHQCLPANRRDYIISGIQAARGVMNAFHNEPITIPIGYKDIGIRWYGRDIAFGEDKKIVFGIAFQSLENDQDYIFAFKGASGIAEFVEGAEVKPTKLTFDGFVERAIPEDVRVERGFLSIYRTMDDEVKGLLEDLKPKKLVVVGDSLGVPLSQLFTTEILSRGLRKPREGHSTSLLTYGTPRLGNKAFFSFFNDLLNMNDVNALTVNNVNDIVPDYPPFYAKALNEELLIEFQNSHPRIAGNHEAKFYIKALEEMPICPE